MNALLWKMKRKLCKNKTRLLMAFVAPIAYLIFLHVFAIDIRQIVCFFPFLYGLFIPLVLGDVEDLIFGEVFLTTRISPKYFWRFKYIFFSLFGTVMGIIYIFLYTLIANFVLGIKLETDITLILMIVASFLLTLGINACGMLHYCDFSKIKQLFASVFNILSLVLLFFFASFGKKEIVKSIGWCPIAILGILLIVISEVINSRVSSEALLDSIKKMVDGYNSKIVDD